MLPLGAVTRLGWAAMYDEECLTMIWLESKAFPLKWPTTTTGMLG